ncbi:stage VI sporulation protein F [Salipaludibacillus aurantiacus]|uniref:Stage VI sporulation protein F n=1 Tax=Salipaludibacillus aurantiacus TaxID=1601833 RepID=A0A1H9PA53_9BACI|nr:stage VI sporulation protein F [Salipaludibacillus aurantiacus]SER44765.1 Stage VI sporulation protein F [Salipaludibacillus aurantiacus]
MERKNNSFFDDLEKKTNVKHQDLFKLAQSVNQTDLSNEKNVRQLIHQVAQMANVPVSKQKEDELVKAITSNQIPMDFGTLAKMFQKSK